MRASVWAEGDTKQIHLTGVTHKSVDSNSLYETINWGQEDQFKNLKTLSRPPAKWPQWKVYFSTKIASWS